MHARSLHGCTRMGMHTLPSAMQQHTHTSMCRSEVGSRREAGLGSARRAEGDRPGACRSAQYTSKAATAHAYTSTEEGRASIGITARSRGAAVMRRPTGPGGVPHRSCPMFLVLLPALCRPSSVSSAGGGALLQRGLGLHDEGRAVEALALYDAALAAHPTLGAAVLAPKAAALEELGRFGDAQAVAVTIGEDDFWQLEVAFALGWQRRGRVEEAIAAYRRAAVPEAAVRQVQLNLGLALRAQGRLEEAIHSLRHAATLSIDDTARADSQFHLGVSLKRLDRATEAAAAFRSCLLAAPDHPEARHLLAALDASSGSTVPSKASESYVRGVFNAAAAGYDQHLEGKLQYKGPELLRHAVNSVIGASAADLRRQGVVLDLGCGTGLVGGWLRPLAGRSRLVGVDLSPRMIEQAEAKGVYDDLIVGDILAFLSAMLEEDEGSRTPASLIVAADVFVYLGDLLPVLTAAAAVLQQDGLLAFTIEDCARSNAATTSNDTAAGRGRLGSRRYPCTRLDERSGVPAPSFCTEEDDEAAARLERCAQQGLVLQSNGRFAHSRQHVLSAASAAGLQVAVEDEVSAREEGGHPVPGRLYVLTRPSPVPPTSRLAR